MDTEVKSIRQLPEANELAALIRREAALRAACEAAYKRLADRPHDAEWGYDRELREQLERALGLKQWEKYI